MDLHRSTVNGVKDRHHQFDPETLFWGYPDSSYAFGFLSMSAMIKSGGKAARPHKRQMQADNR